MPNRYLCTVLDEMRACWKTRNFAPMTGLIEEVQSLANRMESALGDKGDIQRFWRVRCKLRDDIKKLKAEKNKLLREQGKEPEEDESRHPW